MRPTVKLMLHVVVHIVLIRHIDQSKQGIYEPQESYNQPRI